MLESRRGTLAIVHEVQGADKVAALRDELEIVRRAVQAREAPWTPHQLTRVHFLRWFLLWDWEVAPERESDGKARSERCYLVFMSCFDGSPHEHMQELFEWAGDAIEPMLANVVGYEKRNAAENARFMLSRAHYADAIHVGAPNLPVQRILGDARIVHEVRELLAAGPYAWLEQNGWVTRDPALGSKKGWDGWDVAATLRRWVHSERSGLQALLEAPRREQQISVHLLLAVGLPILAPLSIAVFPPARPFALAYAGVLAGLAVYLLRGQPDHGNEPDFSRRGELSRVRDDEERAVQNPMTLVTRVRDGFMNVVGLRAALLVVQLISRLRDNRGALGPIFTIHFGRWFLIKHPQRSSERYLVFESNWDFSWESYLDDFTDQDLVRRALNVVWRHTVGYPRVGFLLDGGCHDAGPFLAWVRRHQLRTQVWYTAYPTLDLRTILENEFRRDGLLEELHDKEREKEWLASW
jgi:hypothetical protein